MGLVKSLLLQFSIKDLIDITLVTALFYQLLSTVRGTRAIQMLAGIMSLSFVFWISSIYKLELINWILAHFFESIILILVILFQDELRATLSRFGGPGTLFTKVDVETSSNKEMAELLIDLSRENIGALVAYERKNKIENIIQTGILINAKQSASLLMSIFNSQSPLHDGAVVMRGNKIIAASCLLPLSQKVELSENYGTRHRAGLGLSEQTDSLVFIVSEETGNLTVCFRGQYKKLEGLNEVLGFLESLTIERNIKFLMENN